MTTVIIEAGTLTASREDRVVTGLLLPYGEVGRTNLGRFSVDRGAFTIPQDVSCLNANLGHDSTQPVARVLTATDTDAGIVASFKVAATPEGDALLAKAEDPTERPALSAEVKDVVLRAGRAVAGHLFGAAFVKRGAFPSATLFAADAGDLPEHLEDQASESVTTETITVDGVEYVRKTTSTYSTETVRTDPDDAGEDPADDDTDDTDDTTPDDTKDPDMTLNAAAAPAGLPTGRKARTGGRSVDDVAGLIARATSGDGQARVLLAQEAQNAGNLFAALSDLTTKEGEAGGVGHALGLPGWLGELWSGKDHTRRYLPLWRQGPGLTSLTVKGWEWEVAPEMAEWAGDKTAVHSNKAKTKAAEYTAKRYAGAHDHAREMRDFPNPEYWAAYFRAMTESYSRLSDYGVLAQVFEAATRLEVSASAIPDNVPEALVKIVDGYLTMADDATPTAAVVAPGLWRDLILTPKDQTLEYLSTALRLEDGQVESFSILPGPRTQEPGSVLVGAREAVEVRELPGSPIRVEGLDMARGGIDTGLFGYAMTIIHEPSALQMVTTAGSAPAAD